MKLEHVAIWTYQLEALKGYYERYFGAVANEKYLSKKEFSGTFESYFLSFDSGARLELMALTGIAQGNNANGFESTGLTHIAFSVETADDLNKLYERLKGDGVTIVGEPRMTGDGNRVEITVTP